MNVNPFHLVSLSPWPLLSSLMSSSFLLGVFFFLSSGSQKILVMSLIGLIFISFMWWRDVVRESTFQGNHTSKVMDGLHIGFIFFIVSEMMFFFSFFFSFFFLFLAPSLELGGWPPAGIQPMSYLGIPLFNTILLVSSGVSITWAHHNLLIGKSGQFGLVITILLGGVFLGYQAMEYHESSFTMADSVYGSIFFLTTGFHGLHVFVGVSFLLVVLVRMSVNHLSATHHIGFEVSSWYWHFVDVVWLFLFVVLYWWGS